MTGRSGFVSNSSTASFVLLGFNASELGDVWEDDRFRAEDGERKLDFLCGSEDGCPEGVSLVIGKYLFRIYSDDYASSEAIDFDKILCEVRAIRDRFGMGTPIMAWSGVQVC